ncbi:MAG: tetratricopeptide repeat protein, partial [Planctomycetota bacterium]
MSRPRVFATTLVLGLLLAVPALAGPLEDAKKAEEAKQWADAAELYAQVVEGDASNREAILGLARSATEGYLESHFVRAEEGLNGLLDAEDGDREARLARGRLFLAKGAVVTDPTTKKFVYEDAKVDFQALVDANASDEEAVVGLARAYYEVADFETAVQVVDTFLAEGQSDGSALFWKGQVFYLLATDAFGRTNDLNAEAADYFSKAAGAYEASATADPKGVDALMQLAYCRQYLGERDQARAAYEKVMDLEPENELPLRGIEALYRYEQDEYGRILSELAQKHPKNVPLLFYRGYRHLVRKEWDEAIANFSAYARRATNPGRVWLFLGQAHEGKGDGGKAEEAYVKALAANPDDQEAAGALDRRLREAHFESATSNTAVHAPRDRGPARQGRGVLASGARPLRAGVRRRSERHGGTRPGSHPEPPLRHPARLRGDLQRHGPDVPVLRVRRGPGEGRGVLRPGPRA